MSRDEQQRLDALMALELSYRCAPKHRADRPALAQPTRLTGRHRADVRQTV